MYKKVVKKAGVDIDKAIRQEFIKHIIDIIEEASDLYEDLLLGATIEKDSLANPEYFYDDFMDRLSSFTFISASSQPQLEIPNEDTFDFSGELLILKMITEGVVGTYVELPEKDLNIVLRTKGLDDKVKRKFRTLPGVVSSDVPLGRRFRLLNTKSALIKVSQEILKKKLVIFPFSNSPPLNVFEGIEEYVNYNINSWINTGINKGLSMLETRGI